MTTKVEDKEKDKNEEKNNENQKNNKKADYEILLQDFSYFDLSFKLIVIGNSGN